MERRFIGKTGVEVSAISLGCWIFGMDWWGHRDQADCDRMCSLSVDNGITFFDNGDAYGNGRSDTLFGQWMKNANVARDSIQIGGKVGYDFYSDPGTPGSHKERKQDFSPAFVRMSIEKSLQRLGTDYYDVLTAHNIKLPQFRDDFFAEMIKLRDEGKVRCWGVALGPAIGWREEGHKAMIDHGAQVVQTVMNLFEQDPGREFGETAQACGAGLLARVQDNSGVLKDVIKKDTVLAANDHRKFRDEKWKTFGPQKVELIRHYATDRGMTLHQLACKWLLQQPAVSSITATLVTAAEIQELAAVSEKPSLSREDLKALKHAYDTNWNLGDDAHPCDFKSSVDPSGHVKSGYVQAPVMLA